MKTIQSLYAYVLLVVSILLTIPAFAGSTPPPNQEVVVVEIGLYVNDISQVNEKDESVDVELTLFLKWHDPRLAFHETKHLSQVLYFNNDAAVKELNKIWYPNIVLRNVRGTRDILARSLTIQYDGAVTYYERFTAVVETEIDMHKFPFDQQIITFRLVPFGQDFHRIKLIINENHEGMGHNAHAREWDVDYFKSKVEDTLTYYGNVFPQYEVSIHYSRLSNYYIFKIMIPLFLVVMLSWCVFWLINQPVISRVSVVLVTLLTIVAFQWVILDTTPKVPYHTLFQSIILLSYFLVGLAILALIIGDITSKKHSLLIMKFCRYAFPIIYTIGIIFIGYYFLI